jgi:TolB-like protein/Tfp pilus assembly protein PilF
VTVHRRTRASVEIREEHAAPALARPALVASVALAAVMCVAALAYAWSASRPEPSVALPDVRSIAVLPFTSLGANDDAHLELGMADAVNTRLGRLKHISVRSTSAVQAYAGSAGDPVTIGRALKVDAILEGRIQKAGERIRVTVQLVSARDGASLWTETFDEELANVFAVQDAIALRVARGLALVLEGEEVGRFRWPTNSAKAYEAYLKGRYLWSKRTTESVRASIDHFKQAIDEDPNFALAYAGLADAYSIQAAPLAEPALRKALELDDTIGEAHASLGFYRMFFHWDLPMADDELRLAIALSPNYATAHQWYAISLAVRGRFEEAKAEMATAIECDPLSPNMRADMAQICYFAGEYDAAIAHCREALELDPSFAFAHHYLSAAYAQKGMHDEAVAEIVWSLESGGASPAVVAAHRDAYAAEGWRGIRRVGIQPANPPTTNAIYYAALGETERAIEQLQRGFDERDFFLIYLAVEPELAPLRSDPRFVEIARRVGVV